MQDALFMDAVITPNRSLSRKGVTVLIGAITAINAASAAVFLSMHAAPVPIFLGLDVLAVVLALGASNRSARVAERVQVTLHEVRVTVETPRAVRVVWVSPTRATRVSMIGPEDEAARLVLSEADRGRPVAEALSPSERRAFAKALDRALWKARVAARAES